MKSLTYIIFLILWTAAETAMPSEQGIQTAGLQGSGSGYMFAILITLVWAVLSAVLIVMGLHLLRFLLPAQLLPYLEELTPHQGAIGLLAIGLALLDFLFDLIALRPIIGNVVPQLVALAAGVTMARMAAVGLLSFLEPYKKYLQLIEGNLLYLGIASLAAGVLHLLFGGLYFL